MTNDTILDRWVFTDSDTKTIADLLASGWVQAATCTYAGNLLELTFFRDKVKIEVSFRYSDIKPVRNLGNRFADEGLDRCVCGSKYWEKDRCVDCNTHVLVHRARIVAGA